MKERVFEPNYSSTLGLQQANAQTNMPFGSLLDVQNMNLDSAGGKSTRQGYGRLFELTYTDKVQGLLDYIKMDGTQKIMSYAGSRIYTWDGSSVSTLLSGLTPATPWAWCVYQDRVYAFNGVDSSFTYDGTSYTKPGITAPAHLTLTAIAGGSLSVGSYSYVITFYDEDRGAESNPPSLATAPTATTAGANLTVRLSSFPTVASGETVTHYRVYRKAPSETLYTRVVELDYATYVGGTYDDTSLISGSIEVERDTGQQDEGNTPPPQSRLVCEFSNRLFFVDETDRTLLVYTKRGQPHAVPSENYFRIGYKDGFPIESIEKHGETFLIHKKNSVYILTGDPTEATPKRISGLGTSSRNAAVHDVDNYCYRLTPSGFHRFSPTDYSAIDLRDEYRGAGVSTDESQLDFSSADDITSYYYSKGGTKHVYFNVPNQSNYSTTTYVYDHALNQWVKYLINTPIYAVASWQDSGNKKMIFGDDYGIVWEWDTGSSDGHDDEPDVVNFNPTSASSTVVHDTTQSWSTNQFKGCVLTVREGTGAGQRRRIISNTATSLTLDTSLSLAINTTSACSIGAIDAYVDEFWNSHSKEYQNRLKRMRWVVPYVRRTADIEIEVSVRRDFRSGYDDIQTLSLNVTTSSSLFGTAIFGTSVFAQSTSNLDRLRFTGKYHYYSIRYRYRKAGDRFFWDGHGTSFQVLYDRTK